MSYAPATSVFLTLAQQKKYVAVYTELLADTCTPILAFERVAQKQQEAPAMLLESGLKFNESGSYSFIGVDPYATFQTKNGTTRISYAGESTSSQEDPLSLLRAFHQRFSCAPDPQNNLLGHMMGFFAYDAVRYFEAIPDTQPDDARIPDILFHFYRTHLVFNHETKKIWVASIADVSLDPNHAYEKACAEIDKVIQQLQHASTPMSISIPSAALETTLETETFETDCSDAAFQTHVQNAKKFIQSGDVFQIVLSRTFYKKIKAAPLTIYRILRDTNPTPYLFYLSMPGLVLLGASPEKVVSVQDGNVTIAPIAGTVPVNKEASTEVLLKKLREDPKERAEHMMLVDLSRNDIGAVCVPGSVYVSDLMVGERLTHVMHLVSYVKGKLAAPYDAFDVLKSAFPAGTLSGAPKIRAMELIDTLESSKRHLYGGAVCKIDSAGNLDSCIVIRSGVVQDNVIRVRTGAGIVFDSDPVAEAEETRNKAKGVFKSVIAAENI